MTRPANSRERLIVATAGSLVVLSVLTSSLGLRHPWLTLNENQILYLFSTTAQVIAAVYGLTLTGFLFFRNELTRESDHDETLVEATDELKRRYFVELVVITILVAITLLVCNLAISHESSPHEDHTTVLINTGQSAFAVTFIAIAMFVFDVVAPRRIERASKTLQESVDPTRGEGVRGGLEEFLRNYNQIEVLLQDAGQSYGQATGVTYEWKQPRRLSNSRLAEFLLRGERIDEHLYKRLRSLITLRNAIIHGAEPVVSQDIISASAEVLGQLQAALGGDGVA